MFINVLDNDVFFLIQMLVIQLICLIQKLNLIIYLVEGEKTACLIIRIQLYISVYYSHTDVYFITYIYVYALTIFVGFF